MVEYEVDLFVIGAGSGGVRAGRIAAQHGARVMITEQFRIGGTCVIRGCVPKKLFAYASRFRDDFTDAAAYGWHVPEPTFDWLTLVANKDREIARLSGLYKINAEKAGATMVEERAEVVGPNKVRLVKSDRTVSARVILVASGAAPVLPEIPGIEHAITSNEAFDLKTLPRRLLIIGGGYIGVEFASIFTRLGVKVIQVLRGPNILRGFDDDMRCGLRDALEEAGVDLRFGHSPTFIDKHAGGLSVALSDGTSVDVDHVMVATGRRPNTHGLGLEDVGVALSEDGAVVVDAFSQSSVPSIYAIGDVTDRLQLTPVAVREGQAFADTVFGGRPSAVDHLCVPSAVFATPEIGTVGMSEEQAREHHAVVDIYRSKFRPMKATLSGRAEQTIMKIVVDGIRDRVLGVHILGHDAGEMAQILAIAVKMGASKADFDATMALHPTAAEELVTMRTRSERHERAMPRRHPAPVRLASG